MRYDRANAYSTMRHSGFHASLLCIALSSVFPGSRGPGGTAKGLTGLGKNAILYIQEPGIPADVRHLSGAASMARQGCAGSPLERSAPALAPRF